jgi:hypothetical protein
MVSRLVVVGASVVVPAVWPVSVSWDIVSVGPSPARELSPSADAAPIPENGGQRPARP